MDQRRNPNLAPTRSDAYHFDLPPELVVRAPSPERDDARLFSILANGEVEHRTFRDLPSYLLPGDVLVVNETRVVPGRLRGFRMDDNSPVEILLMHPAGTGRFDVHAVEWIVSVEQNAALPAGARVTLGPLGSCDVLEVFPDGTRHVRFNPGASIASLLAMHGRLAHSPLADPSRADGGVFLERYQSVFGRVEGSLSVSGSALHFTEEMLAGLRERGVAVVPLVMHLGVSNHEPIATESIADYRAAPEWYSIPQATADAIDRAQQEGERVIAVGTAVMRALETSARATGSVAAGEGETGLFIAPEFTFNVVDALLTNFQAPGAWQVVTLAAFLGFDNVFKVYSAAVERGYRFGAFGDALFIARRHLPDVTTQDPGALSFALDRRKRPR